MKREMGPQPTISNHMASEKEVIKMFWQPGSPEKR
jgi:hypothetical protein